MMDLRLDSLYIGQFLHEMVEPVLPIYPLIAENGAPAEFATYRRAGYGYDGTKDGPFGQGVSVVVTVVARTYARSVELAAQVAERLDGLCGRWQGRMVRECTLTDASEDWNEDCYLQILNFSIRIED